MFTLGLISGAVIFVLGLLAGREAREPLEKFVNGEPR